MRGLVVEDKWKRVRNYQRETLNDFTELFAAAGCSTLEQLNRSFINKKVEDGIKNYAELYPPVAHGAYLN